MEVEFTNPAYISAKKRKKEAKSSRCLITTFCLFSVFSFFISSGALALSVLLMLEPKCSCTETVNVQKPSFLLQKNSSAKTVQGITSNSNIRSSSNEYDLLMTTIDSIQKDLTALQNKNLELESNLKSTQEQLLSKQDSNKVNETVIEMCSLATAELNETNQQLIEDYNKLVRQKMFIDEQIQSVKNECIAQINNENLKQNTIRDAFQSHINTSLQRLENLYGYLLTHLNETQLEVQTHSYKLLNQENTTLQTLVSFQQDVIDDLNAAKQQYESSSENLQNFVNFTKGQLEKTDLEFSVRLNLTREMVETQTSNFETYRNTTTHNLELINQSMAANFQLLQANVNSSQEEFFNANADLLAQLTNTQSLIETTNRNLEDHKNATNLSLATSLRDMAAESIRVSTEQEKLAQILEAQNNATTEEIQRLNDTLQLYFSSANERLYTSEVSIEMQRNTTEQKLQLLDNYLEVQLNETAQRQEHTYNILKKHINFTHLELSAINENIDAWINTTQNLSEFLKKEMQNNQQLAEQSVETFKVDWLAELNRTRLAEDKYNQKLENYINRTTDELAQMTDYFQTQLNSTRQGCEFTETTLNATVHVIKQNFQNDIDNFSAALNQANTDHAITVDLFYQQLNDTKDRLDFTKERLIELEDITNSSIAVLESTNLQSLKEVSVKLSQLETSANATQLMINTTNTDFENRQHAINEKLRHSSDVLNTTQQILADIAESFKAESNFTQQSLDELGNRIDILNQTKEDIESGINASRNIIKHFDAKLSTQQREIEVVIDAAKTERIEQFDSLENKLNVSADFLQLQISNSQLRILNTVDQLREQQILTQTQLTSLNTDFSVEVNTSHHRLYDMTENIRNVEQASSERFDNLLTSMSNLNLTLQDSKADVLALAKRTQYLENFTDHLNITMNSYYHPPGRLVIVWYKFVM